MFHASKEDARWLASHKSEGLFIIIYQGAWRDEIRRCIFFPKDEAFGAGYEEAGAIGMRGAGNTCAVVGELACAALNGVFQGIGTSCDGTCP